MFGKFKDKLKSALSVFSKKVDEEAETISPEKEDIVAKPKDVKKPSAEKKPSQLKPASTKKKPLSKTSSKKDVPVKDLPKEEPVVESITVPEEKEQLESTDSSPKKPGFLSGLFSKKKPSSPKEGSILEKETLESESSSMPSDSKVPVLDEDDKIKDTETEKKDTRSIFTKVTDSFSKKRISEEKFEELFSDLEMLLLESNTSFDVVQKIKEDLKIAIVNKDIRRSELSEVILASLRESIRSLFDVPSIDLLTSANEKKPLIISFIGVNGSGKTTQLAKVAKYFLDNNKTCVMAACDTFRAAAIQQLEEHANNLNVKIIKHSYGADAAAVAFDAIEHAKAKGIDVVLLDTAGRLHSNTNLMQELKKLLRVAKPDFSFFVGESITGNDCINQATEFLETVPLDGVILTKADVDDKGGTAISISYVTKKPIVFLGTGQEYSDLEVFDKEKLLRSLGL